MTTRWSSALALCAALTWGGRAHAAEIVAPSPIATPMPHAPAGASASARSDTALWVELTVDEAGRVSDVQPEAALDAATLQQVEQTLRGWRFEPATLDGEPHAARIRVRVVFQGDSVVSMREPARAEGATPAATPLNAPLVNASQTAPLRDEQIAPNPNSPSVEVIVEGAERPLTAGSIKRDRRVLSAAPHASGSDLLRTLPGVFLTQHSGEGKAHQLFFRGFDAVHGQDMEIEVAGAPVNEVSNVHGQGYADLHFVIPETVSELTLLPGPFDPAQGDFAVAGSARYRLGFPHEGVSAKAGMGSYGARRALLALRPVGRPETDFVALELADSNGFGSRRALQRMSVLSQLTGSLTPALEYRAMAGYYAGRFESPGVLRWDDLEAGRVARGASYDGRQGGNSERAQLSFELTWQRADAETRITPYFVHRDLELRYNYTGALAHPVTDLTEQKNVTATLGARAEHERRMPLFTSRDELSVGLSAQHDRITQGQVIGDEPTSLVDAEIRGNRAAGWLGLALHGIPRSVLHAGVRADALWFDVSDALGDARRRSHGVHVGPKGALDVALAPAWHLQLAGARGFRSPQARSLGDGEATPFTRVTAAEVGTRYAPGRALDASFSAFSSWLEDDLVFDEATSRNERAPSSRRSGLAADVTVHSRSLVSSCGGTLSEAVFTASDQRFSRFQAVPYVPRVVARCDFTLERDLTELGGRRLLGALGFGQQLVWLRPLPYAELDPGFVLTDVSLRMRWSHFELRLDVENLFDAKWTDGEFVYASNFPQATPSALPQRHVTTGAPRTLLLTLGVLGLQ